MDGPRKPIRWGGAAAIAIMAVIALVVVWLRDVSQQHHVLGTGIVLIVASFLLFLWAILLSRLPGRVRLFIFLGGAAAIAFCVSSLEIKGVTGDLIPIIRFKGAKPKVVATSAASLITTNAETSEFPQFLGPNRNGVIKRIVVNTNWNETPPELLWRRPVGSGWSGFAISSGLAITQEQQDNRELVNAYDLRNGAPKWSHSDESRYFTTLGGEGPRTTPTIVGERVFTLGPTGILNCLDRGTGKLIWTHNLAREYSAKVPEWGFAGSPLYFNGQVIVCAGGHPNRTLVAHDAETGKFLWGGGDDSAGYSSPTLLTLAGVEQIVLFTHKFVSGFDPQKGTPLWSHPWPPSHPHVTMPIQIGTNQLLVSSGYGYGSELLEIAKSNEVFSASRVWKSNRLKSKFANLIFYSGFVYGLDDGILACLDPATGERKWHGERHGHGQMLLVGDIILLMAENGEVLLIEPSPESERVVASFRAFKSKTWNPPALAGSFLLVRNDLEAACFKLPVSARISQ